MDGKDKTFGDAIARFNLEDMVSRAIDKNFSRDNKEETKMDFNEAITEVVGSGIEEITDFDMEEVIEQDSELSEGATRILEFLKTQSDPVGKSAILDAICLPEHMWNPSIKELKEEDLAIQHGNRRGAKYTTN